MKRFKDKKGNIYNVITPNLISNFEKDKNYVELPKQNNKSNESTSKKSEAKNENERSN